MHYRLEQWTGTQWQLLSAYPTYWESSLAINYLMSNRLCCRLLRSDDKGFTRVVEAHF